MDNLTLSLINSASPANTREQSEESNKESESELFSQFFEKGLKLKPRDSEPNLTDVDTETDKASLLLSYPLAGTLKPTLKEPSQAPAAPLLQIQYRQESIRQSPIKPPPKRRQQR